ncbi:hypothetical protein KPL70_015161 [Citrus sinensis]|uniref:uncharacterized protein LOC102631218 n=1 Tax=Citrus sinensis TaxID=2711 RepID=UPI00219057BE|nr:uncharacterized protein LOC102631218 [Citrus sinensis]KAH9688554.1 hypothetical protein KPL70_015161 [Citrus sinensis]
MENCTVNISEELRVAESKKETLRRSFDIAHSQANSMLLLTVQWKDLEEHFDITKKLLEKQSNDVDGKIRLLDQRAKEIESKEIQLVLVQKKIEDCNGELVCKEKQLGLVQKKIGECNCKLQLKKNELNSLSESLNLKKEELSSVQDWINKCQAHQKELRLLRNMIEECCDEIELREKKVGEVQRSIEEREKQLAFKESKISSIQTLIEEYEEVLQEKEKSYDEVKKSLILCETKLECKKKELELTQSSIKELSVKLHPGEEKLELLQGKVRLHENEVESLEQKLDSMRKQQKKYFDDVELKKREFNEIRKYIEELNQDLASKHKQLKFVQQSIEECSKEFQWKKEELISIEKTIAECSKEVELIKNQLNLIHNESNLVQTRTIVCLKELKDKEKHVDSLKKGLEGRLQDLEVKEREFEKRVKEFELREKEFDSIQKAVQDRSKNLLLQVKIEDPENLTSRGRYLQCLLNQHLQKHDLIFCKVFDTVKRACDPALLVLHAMSGFYPPHSRERDLEFDVSIIRRSCILLLEQLSTIAPEINVQVRDEAMKVAGEWKKKMRVAVENSLEVLGFLHLLAAYRLAPAFDGEELESLLRIVAQHRQTPKLRQTLGFGDKVPGLQCSITAEGRSSSSMLVGNSAPTNQPVPGPMNLPQYTGMNPSNSTSSPVARFNGVQPQLHNQYKRLRRESPAIIAYMPQTPASGNLSRSSLATLYGPGVARIGGQTQFGLLAANMADGESSDNKQEYDPFLVHPSDSPTIVLVSPLLTGNNYGTWVRAMTMALRARNKLGFVDGTITKPDDDAGGKWQRCNDLVRSWVLNSISSELACSVLYAQSARELWLHLQERFQQNASKIYKLKQGISSLRQGDVAVHLYYRIMKKLWRKLNSLQHLEPCVSGKAKVVNELQQQDFGMEFLQGLHDRYAAIRSRILLMDPFPKAHEILALIKKEKTQQDLHALGGPSKAAALAIPNRQPLLHSSLDNRMGNDISADSSVSNLNGISGNDQRRQTCEHCGKLGHTKLNCFELNGYPTNCKKRRRGSKGNPKAAATVAGKEQQDLIFAQ